MQVQEQNYQYKKLFKKDKQNIQKDINKQEIKLIKCFVNLQKNKLIYVEILLCLNMNKYNINLQKLEYIVN